ncbi:hypothetical protein CEXT_398041 [Caerostris extrusa]|uniref:Uncharacterized protein n=1 Tax=Caerostris extrusa TaxID=172846 RepID=A0AAV4NK42_CAEEX|nr:hypothetical protein CEXT_398041 [Caerostris extrusa]
MGQADFVRSENSARVAESCTVPTTHPELVLAFINAHLRSSAHCLQDVGGSSHTTRVDAPPGTVACDNTSGRSLALTQGSFDTRLAFPVACNIKTGN